MTEVSPREVGAFLRAGGEDIFALLTMPVGESRNVAVVLLQGGAWTPSFGRGRGLRRLAHRLAFEGFHVARFDYHGVGESSGEVRTFRLDEPFVADLKEVVRWLATDHGLERVVLMATCFGARTALATAPEIPGLEAVALFPAPVRDLELGERFSSYPFRWYLRRLFRARTFKRLFNARFRKAYRKLFKIKARRLGRGLRSSGEGQASRPQEVSRLFLKHLKALLARRIPIFMLYGDADNDYEDFARALSGELGEVVTNAKPQLKLEVIEGHVHGLTNLANQDRVIELLAGWVALEVGGGKLSRASN